MSAIFTWLAVLGALSSAMSAGEFQRRIERTSTSGVLADLTSNCCLNVLLECRADGMRQLIFVSVLYQVLLPVRPSGPVVV